MAGDKGMAGSYNETVLSFAYQEIQRYPGSHLATVGVLANDFFRKKGMVPDYEVVGMAQNPRSTTLWRSPRRSSTSSTRGRWTRSA